MMKSNPKMLSFQIINISHITGKKMRAIANERPEFDSQHRYNTIQNLPP
jgi:hypothetical protein